MVFDTDASPQTAPRILDIAISLQRNLLYSCALRMPSLFSLLFDYRCEFAAKSAFDIVIFIYFLSRTIR